jgi:metal-responsive CopG/Arc/MetJ family transcriptional regulator
MRDEVADVGSHRYNLVDHGEEYLMVAAHKIVQVPMDAMLLDALDAASKHGKTSRSEIIRRACREYLRRLRAEALDEAYERGYRRLPEDSSLGEVQTELAGQVLPKETW